MKKYRYVAAVFGLCCFWITACGGQQSQETAPNEAEISEVKVQEEIKMQEEASPVLGVDVEASDVEETAEEADTDEQIVPAKKEDVQEKAEKEEEEESKIYVYMRGDTLGERGSWYFSKEYFLEKFGFADKEPIYQYEPESGEDVFIYLDEERKIVCGLRYDPYERGKFPEGNGVYGFVTEWAEAGNWEGFGVEDYMAPVSIWGGNGSEDVLDYTENVEYDEEGRLISFESKGVVPDIDIEFEEPITILHMEYTYHENGMLKSRKYGHSHFVFPTTASSIRSYFDEQGRLFFESSYITHGSIDEHYIYEGDSSIPRYCLSLDFTDNIYYPIFYEYKVQ